MQNGRLSCASIRVQWAKNSERWLHRVFQTEVSFSLVFFFSRLKNIKKRFPAVFSAKVEKQASKDDGQDDYGRRTVDRWILFSQLWAPINYNRIRKVWSARRALRYQQMHTCRCLFDNDVREPDLIADFYSSMSRDAHFRMLYCFFVYVLLNVWINSIVWGCDGYLFIIHP